MLLISGVQWLATVSGCWSLVKIVFLLLAPHLRYMDMNNMLSKRYVATCEIFLLLHDLTVCLMNRIGLRTTHSIPVA